MTLATTRPRLCVGRQPRHNPRILPPLPSRRRGNATDSLTSIEFADSNDYAPTSARARFKRRDDWFMGAAFSTICWVNCLLCAAPISLPSSPAGGDGRVGVQQACPSYLCQPAYCLDDILRGPCESYLPQPG